MNISRRGRSPVRRRQEEDWRHHPREEEHHRREREEGRRREDELDLRREERNREQMSKEQRSREQRSTEEASFLDLAQIVRREVQRALLGLLPQPVASGGVDQSRPGQAVQTAPNWAELLGRNTSN